MQTPADEGPSEATLDAYLEDAQAAVATGHLMRVRVRKPVWAQLQDIAELESERLNCHITASDIVRAAIGTHLGLHESLEELRNMAPDALGNETLVFDGVA
jgi:hypothetical protein